MYKQERIKRNKALIKIFTELLISHNIPCKGNGYDTIKELKKQFNSIFISLNKEISIIVNIISNNIYQRAYNIAFSEYKKRSSSISKSSIQAFAQKEKNRFLTIIKASIKQPYGWETHLIAELSDAHIYSMQFYFLPREEELESLFFFFSDNQMQKRWVEAQK